MRSKMERLLQEIEDWLRRSPNPLLAGVAFLIVGSLGGVITGNDLFWLIFLIGLVFLLFELSNRYSPSPPKSIEKKQVPQDQVQFPSSQVSQRKEVGMAKRTPLIISHWYHLIESFQDSPQRFYASLEEVINRSHTPERRIKCQRQQSGF